ncbi:hypothetical protein Cgig2_001034 [Carnegiea gigantea]|uniref:Uncharacterized protein n=1 Tax=Carnegiea gigantea TaxID=171969 RepID=A0A9Q1JFF5_9CARY|nr:hypothetical protein Cgig2_001034 [Carnegiea gigantea]
MQLTLIVGLDLKNKSKPQSLMKELPKGGTLPNALQLRSAQAARHPMLRKPRPMTTVPKPHNVRRYYEFHARNGHTTNKCKELKQALHELAEKGQIDLFLKRGLAQPRAHGASRGGMLHRGSSQYRRWVCRRNYSISMEGPTTGDAAGPNGRTGEPHYSPYRGVQGSRRSHLSSPHTDPLVVDLKVANALVP